MRFKKELMDNGILLVAVILNFIFFTFNFYKGMSSSDWISFVLAGASMTAILFCVWVIGYKHALGKVKKTLPLRPVYQRATVPTFVEIRPVPIKKSDIDRFVTKKVKKTEQEEWKEYQEKNK